MADHVTLDTRSGTSRIDARLGPGRAKHRTKPDLITVILPVRGWPASLEDQLQALARQTWCGQWELLVVDNGGSRPVDDLVERWAPDLPIRIVAARDKEGINFARNRGIGESKGDLLAFCDADDIVNEGWLAGLASAAPTSDLVGGRLDEELLNGSTDGLRPRMPSDRLPVALGFLPFAVGANCAVWADVVQEIGPFDERYLIGNDDVEFSFRAQLLGYRLRYAPGAVVAYRHRERGREMFRQFCHYGRTEPLLYRSFRQWGMQRPTGWQVAKRWIRIGLEIPLLVSSTRRSAWLVRAGFSTGRLQGAIRYRTPYL
jgi:GT2 family glycosyltransferase